MIPVTRPFMPPKAEYDEYINGIWERQWLTNNGPLVNELELSLKEYLDLKHLLYLGNGTIALQIAIKALGLKGEIITTPFSYVATTSSIVWENCKPVFVDIDENTLNIDPLKIQAAITPDTTGILCTHVYGNPCDIQAISSIAASNNLKVVYDAAHCFGTKYKGQSVFKYGDISTCSFHATKLFHTIEGGAVFTENSELLRTMAYLRNFGHDGQENYFGLGINGKNSEVHAAMGLVNLKYANEILQKRKVLFHRYNEKLVKLRVYQPKILTDAEPNYSYYPIVMESEEILMKSILELNKNLIFPRRYFYPELSSLPYVDKAEVPLTADISRRVMCLPLYHSLTFEEIDLISRILLRIQNN